MILVYTTNDRAEEARRLTENLRADLRNAKFWPSSGPEKWSADEAVRRVLVLSGVPYEAEIVAGYEEVGMPVEVVGAGAPERASPEPSSPRPSDPWPASMTLAPDKYAERYPSGPNSDLARAWVKFLADHPGEELWRE